ncbi:hypothetical protein CEUSTIGMA_g2730.t1 [Chlamydomonas eustigma]|uniref:Signal recognition particle subunit SRP68 n=1 Tax=Chlamydomonas eustigma TaxID=1157962 RepID=A0A250WWW7_9CHLO|nr:hypothetical protein CEUSTIGMA_g2730.t1 [Chlamydomonas eustigma]|eukprot:GAX75285.1 hypothetical protein CEUSTIGMA_g2730.t1 [Chlamydomonas eustigma]
MATTNMDDGMDCDSPASQQTYTLRIFQLIRTEQAQNGVKHNDYSRYRRHCANKVQSLYKVLNFQHGRTKYIKRKIEVQTVTDIRFLHVLLFNAERAWSYAMELKKEIEANMSLQKRNHLIRRLTKACTWSSDLAKLSESCADTRGSLEAQAYAAWMHGSMLLEKESNWVLALAKFTRASMLYEELSKVVPLENQSQFLQLIEESEPSIRYCSYQLDRKGIAAPAEKLLLIESDPEGQAGLDSIKAKLAVLTGEYQAQQKVQDISSTAAALEWQGKKYSIKAERARACISQANEFVKQIVSAPPGDEAVLQLYNRMIASYNEAKSHVKNALKASSAAEGDPAYEEMASVEMALQGVVLERIADRSILLIHEAEGRFSAGMERIALGKRAREKDKYARAEDVVRLLDAAIRVVRELGELGARLGGRSGEALHDRCSAQASQLGARRCFYLAQGQLAAGKALESYALFVRCLERIKEARERVEELPGSPDEAALKELKRTEERAGAYKAVAQAELCADELKVKEATEQGLRGISLSDQPLAGSVGVGYLLDHLDSSWESFAGQPGSKAPRIFKAPFSMQSIPVGPIVLDTASNMVTYPSLEHRVKKQTEKKSVLSSIFGWGGSSAKK